MKCRECLAAEYNPHRRAWFCRCTGAEVRIAARANFVMPFLGMRDGQQNWLDGDDDRLFCPSRLDGLLGSARGQRLVLSILTQIAQHGQLDFCLSLYPKKAADKLTALMSAERLRLLMLNDRGLQSGAPVDYPPLPSRKRGVEKAGEEPSGSLTGNTRRTA